jgi:hypothetical protein
MAVVDRNKLQEHREAQRRLTTVLPAYIDGNHVPRFEYRDSWTADGADEVETLLRNLADSTLTADDRAALEARVADPVRERAREVVETGVGGGEGRDIALESFDKAHPERPKDVLDTATWNAAKSRVARFATFVAAADAVAEQLQR